MKEISIQKITEVVETLCHKAACSLGKGVEDLLRAGLEQEEAELGRDIFCQMLANLELARRKKTPICQDTGIVVVYLELGQDVRLVGGNLEEAIHEGVRRGYASGYLRKSVVADPLFKRLNTLDNTPALIFTEIVPGDKLKIIFLPKGAGSENMSAIKMLKPSAGVEGVRDFVVQTVTEAGGNPCPPLIVGVGIGGTFEKAAILAKRALTREAGQPNPNADYARLEKEILRRINLSGVGPQGLGGRITALAVHIEEYPTHLASLPVAVNLSCHVSRHLEAIL